MENTTAATPPREVAVLTDAETGHEHARDLPRFRTGPNRRSTRAWHMRTSHAYRVRTGHALRLTFEAVES